MDHCPAWRWACDDCTSRIIGDTLGERVGACTFGATAVDVPDDEGLLGPNAPKLLLVDAEEGDGARTVAEGAAGGGLGREGAGATEGVLGREGVYVVLEERLLLLLPNDPKLEDPDEEREELIELELDRELDPEEPLASTVNTGAINATDTATTTDRIHVRIAIPFKSINYISLISKPQ